MKRKIISAIMTIAMVFLVLSGSLTSAAAAAKAPAKPTTLSVAFDIINNLKKTVSSFKQSIGENEVYWGKELLTKPLKVGESTKVNLTWKST
jgi:hypothetical protein